MDIGSFLSATIGAVVGGAFTLGGVLWSARIEQNKAKLLAKQQMRSLLQSIHDEVEALWESYMSTIGAVVDCLETGKPIDSYWPVTQDYFVVFHENATRVAEIENANLRKLIISTYVSAKGLVDSYRLNNDSVQKCEQATWLFQRTKAEVDQLRALAEMNSLIAYAGKLKELHSEVKGNVQSLILELKKAGCS